MLIDSHCHLNYPGLREDVAGVLDRARAAGVGGFLGISTRQSEWDEVIALADAEADVWATVGIHPHEADVHPDTDAATLIEATRHGRVIGIGETGLDYYYDKSDRERQRASFRAHILASRATGLPLIVHTREAEADTLALLREPGEGALRGVIHCFTASQDFAEQALALGFYISLSGIVTFKNARDLQASAMTIPGDRLLVETDAPFLAPIPMRGKTCEPGFVAHTAKFVAGLRGETVEALAASTSDNFFALFSKAVRPA
ncbi:TatD-related deoxyribonuclease [Polymorphobacter glacialis]|uniref:TatD-related deoxyribonuclease n=1 Tax=Sandarakinorhabdus glacialis TaxID=1614636 RepID=A0A916ZMG5_9SPHN|nr:TatD family hydrolase [Polymorphobacter glacialis]GGE04576.1 TatD-related deoxyribonuclease [Polymorphobacter glacialis]